MCLNHPCSDPSVGPRSVRLPQANWVIILHFVIRGTFFLSMEPTLLTADTSISPFVIQWILLTPDSRTTPGRAAVNICKRRARLGSLCLSSLPHAERGKIQADEMWEGGAVFETESKHYVRAVVVSLPTTATFNTGPHVLVPPNRKIVFVATYSYSFAIIHHNVNICVFWWSWMIYVKGLFDTRRGCNPWLRTTAWGDSVPGKPRQRCKRAHRREEKPQELGRCTVLQALNQELYIMRSTWSPTQRPDSGNGHTSECIPYTLVWLST